jgi:hypothetical protein
MSNDTLPVVRDQRHVEQLEWFMRLRDGPFSVSNRFVPHEANDVGDSLRANPLASDLGYVDAECDISHVGDAHVMHDGTASIRVEECVIEDVSEWN